ncbi:MAG TPA: ferrous iron transport protein B [Polyangiaceae bacterium]|nr:ferrous iron transport protein B [Polyangiaceae bacterium]
MSAAPASDGPIQAQPIAPLVANAAPLVLLVGNPNVGKTTLFNALTGQRARVGNYPGVTVDRRSGTLETSSTHEQRTPLLATVVDVPGAYSLCGRSTDEQIAINAVLGFGGNPQPNLVCVVMEAGQLSRNAYLLLQLCELQVPLLMIVNMIDEVDDQRPNLETLSTLFGVPVVATNARAGEGIDPLRDAIFAALKHPQIPKLHIDYPALTQADADRIVADLPAAWRTSIERDRALARWALSSIDTDDELEAIPIDLRRAVLTLQQETKNQDGAAEHPRDWDREIITARYGWIDRHFPSIYKSQAPSVSRVERLTDRIDRVLLHPVYGFAIFVAVMTLLFQALFTWAQPAISVTEDSVAFLQSLATDLLPAGVLRDALVEGVLGGVGNVVVFLPQILLLFVFIGLLEDSGYMARVAYLMDRVLRSVGLHGRAFVPMLSGFACAIPAIMATRTMERRRDRLLTMLVVPLMSCSARLPVYSLIIVTLFPASRLLGFIPLQGLLMIAMYLFSTTMSLVAASVLGRTAVKGRRVPLILELPRYRRPKVRGVLRMAAERALSFLREAGTMILACTMILWVLLSFPKAPQATSVPSAPVASASIQTPQAAPAAKTPIEYSLGGRFGKAIEPALKPLGFDWKIGIGLVGAFAAREVFVSTLGLVYGLDDSKNDDRSLREKIQADVRADGSPRYTPLMGLSLMLFFALACQCMSTLAVVRRETRSWRWPLFMFAYMGTLAYAVSFTVFQVGQLVGF